MSRRKKAKLRETSTNSSHELNRNINFKRENEKTNARKWPTNVICIKCKEKFVLPFKPRRPDIYCDACFRKKK